MLTIRAVRILCSFILSISFAHGQSLWVVTENFPPYQIVVDGQLVGGETVDIVNKMLKVAEIEAKIIVLPWARALNFAKTEKNTIVFSIYRTPERETHFKWIGPILTVTTKFYIARNNSTNTDVTNIKEALEKTAVAVRGSATADHLQLLGFVEGINLILVKDYQTVWALLHKGRADLTYSEPPNPFLLKEVNIGINTFEPLPFYETQRDLYIAAHIETSDELITRLTIALNNIKHHP